MLRRLIVLLATVFVLFGTISPSLACATQADKGDCCPSGTPAPCREDPRGIVPATAVACCATSSQATSTSVSVSREQSAQFPDHIGSPDPLIAAVWLATVSPSSHSTTSPPPTPRSVRSTGELTYLQTMRLRL